MKKLTKVLLLVAAVALIGSEAFATNGMRMIGFGPAQRSMGGAGSAANLDSATILTNPAGIADLCPRVDFGASYFAFTVKEETPLGNFESDKGAQPIPAFGMVVPISENMNFGLGAYGIAGMGVDYNTQGAAAPGGFGGITYTDYTQMRFAPGVSYKVNDMISVGLTANIMYATMEFSMQGQAAMKSSAFGGGATIGVQVKPIEILTIGLAYESQSYFQDFKFNKTSEAGVMNMEFNQPMNATLGFAVTPIEGLKVALDVQWIKWSDTNDLVEGKINGATVMPMTMKWDDQLVYKLGVEYQAIEILKVRAGFNYGKMPLSDANDTTAQGTVAGANMAFPAVAEMHFTGGVEVALNDKTSISLGGMYSPESSVTQKVTAMGGANMTAKMSQYSIDAGISYKFGSAK